jgi:hypothetical protein
LLGDIQKICEEVADVNKSSNLEKILDQLPDEEERIEPDTKTPE